MGFIQEESGQTILEYALIIAVLVLVTIASIPPLRNAIQGVFNEVQEHITNSPTP